MSEEQPKISQEQMAALLGRPLATAETENYDLYLQIALLRLNDLLCIKIEEMASIPADLQLLIARCFATITQEQSMAANHGINKKQVEDFSISYEADPSSPMVLFVDQNSATIEKYGACQGSIRSGKVICDDCFRCI